MRHLKRGRKLGRNSPHRTSLKRNLLLGLFSHERIRTTLPKAKELRPYVERLITLAKRGVASGDKIKELHARRMLLARLGPVAKVELLDAKGKGTGETVIGKLFKDLAPRFKDRPGGYTRIMKLTKCRLGDAGETAMIELLKEGETRIQASEKKAASPAPAPAPVAAPAPLRTRYNSLIDDEFGERPSLRSLAPRSSDHFLSTPFFSTVRLSAAVSWRSFDLFPLS